VTTQTLEFSVIGLLLLALSDGYLTVNRSRC